MADNKYFLNGEEFLEVILSGNQDREDIERIIEGTLKIGNDLRRKHIPVRVLVDLTDAGRFSMDATFAAGHSYMKNPAEKVALFGGSGLNRQAVNTVAEIKGAASLLRYFKTRTEAEEWLRGTGFMMKLVNRISETKDVQSFLWKAEGAVSWKAGQFMVYELPHKKPDSRKISRFFTVSSAPFEGLPMITTKLANEKSSSFKKALFSMNIGEYIEAHPPRGAFTLDDVSKKYCFVAGGIGITPFRSILLQLEHEKKEIDVVLIYANRTSDIVFKKEFDELTKRVRSVKVVYLVEPERVMEDVIRVSAPDFRDRIFYLSGPRPMVEAMERLLETMQIPSDVVKTDYFPGYLSY